jgi:rsbT antagonist protein RsbS
VEETRTGPRIAIQSNQGSLIASIQVGLSGPVLQQFQGDLLERVASDGASAVVIDLSGVAIIDAEDFEFLRRTVAMASIMGAKSIIAGLRPGVASSLVEMDVDLKGIQTAHDLDAALDELNGERDSEPVADHEEEIVTEDENCGHESETGGATAPDLDDACSPPT